MSDIPYWERRKKQQRQKFQQIIKAAVEGLSKIDAGVEQIEIKDVAVDISVYTADIIKQAR
jgi:hypothetical protein